MRSLWNCYDKMEFFFTNVMFARLFQNMKNGPMCKEKWQSIVRDFKNFFDHMSRTWHKQKILISMNLQHKVLVHLPNFFNKNVIDVVLELFWKNQSTFCSWSHEWSHERQKWCNRYDWFKETSWRINCAYEPQVHNCESQVDHSHGLQANPPQVDEDFLFQNYDASN